MATSPRNAGRWILTGLFAAGTVAAMAATVLWVRDAVNTAFFLRSESDAQRARAALQESVDRHVRDVGQVAADVSDEADFGPDAFQRRAARAVGDGAAVRALDFLDRSGRALWTFPFSPERAGRALAGDRADAATRAERTQRTTASGLIEMWDGGVGVALYAPVFRRAAWSGLVESTLEVLRVAAGGAPALGDRFDVTIVDERQGREYRATESRGRAPAAYDNYFPLALADRTWWIILHPLRPPPALAIVSSTLFAEALLGGLIVYLLWRRKSP